jgi:predicted ATPase/DNA-binding CsgD family transcriptional regulator
LGVASTRSPAFLPAELSSFVDRRQELIDVRRLLSQSRLVTVSGAGGVGKSRLALRLAAQSQRTFDGGVRLVELASVSDPSLVAETVASSLQVPGRSNRDPLEALTTSLAGKSLLLVLDNCEQLTDACGPLVAELLRHAPQLRVLVTSRELLGLPGEAVYRLQPLRVPAEADSVAGASTYSAVSLFADRAATAMNGFAISSDNIEAVAGLCRRLDGMPLAIELAAAHTRSLSPRQILERLDDRFRLLAGRGAGVHPRHRSLRAAVEWSYDLCSKPEQLMWNRLSVFAGDFDLAAAEAVCGGPGMSTPDVAKAIADLVDKSVVVSEPHPTGMRYRLLETIREYGLHRLRDPVAPVDETAVPESVLRVHHLGWYVELAGEYDRAWFGPRQAEWLERLGGELPNIRAALSFAVDNPEHARAGLRLAGNLCFFWRLTAMREGESWMRRLLDLDPEPTRERARALSAVAWQKAAKGEREASMEVAQESLDLAMSHDPERVARAMLLLGTLTRLHDQDKGMDLLEEAVVRARELGSDAETAYAVFGLGWALGLSGEPAAAGPMFAECVDICTAAGEHWWRGVVNLRRALVAWLHDDAAGMAAAAAESVLAAGEVPDLLTCADAVNILAALQVGEDDSRAAYLLGAADRYWQDAGGSIVHSPPWAGLLEERMSRCRVCLGDVVYDAAYRRGKEDPLEAAIATALGQRRQPTEARAHEGPTDFGLTRRELEVVRLIAEGLTNKQIADRLVISPRTAETHVQNVLVKSGFTTRGQIAAWYAEQGH